MKNMYLTIILQHKFIRAGTYGGDRKNVNIRDDWKRDKQTNKNYKNSNKPQC